MTPRYKLYLSNYTARSHALGQLHGLAMTLTRPQFELACKAYLAKYPSVSSLSYDGHANGLLKRYPSGWTWNEHPVRSKVLLVLRDS